MQALKVVPLTRDEFCDMEVVKEFTDGSVTVSEVNHPNHGALIVFDSPFHTDLYAVPKT